MDQIVLMYNELLKTHPWMAAALPLWLAGIGTVMMRTYPMRIYNSIRRQFITTLSLDSSGGGDVERQYRALQDWFENRGSTGSIRKLMWDPEFGASDVKLHPGIGRFYFMYKGRVGWFEKVRVESQGGRSDFTYTVSVSLVSRKRSLMNELVEDFRWRWKPSRPMIHGVRDGKSWKRMKRLTERSLDSVILNAGVMENLRTRIEHFRSSRQWYLDNGIPYRLIILIHGPPGTGKTSVIRALASHFEYSVAPIVGADELTFKVLVEGVEPRTFLIAEDFDSYTQLLLPEFQEEGPTSSLTKSTFLQTIDGLDLLDGQIIFLTTNHLNRIEPAVYRDERVNMVLELAALESEAVTRYITMRFPKETAHQSMEFEPIVGASLQKAYVKNPDSYLDFLNSIPVSNPDIVSDLPATETV